MNALNVLDTIGVQAVLPRFCDERRRVARAFSGEPPRIGLVGCSSNSPVFAEGLGHGLLSANAWTTKQQCFPRQCVTTSLR
jgi:hypothetical protein